jgi:hypothetical protein
VLGAVMDMAAGLIFLVFSYIMHVAHMRNSLFGSGLLIEEQDKAENTSQ